MESTTCKHCGAMIERGGHTGGKWKHAGSQSAAQIVKHNEKGEGPKPK